MFKLNYVIALFMRKFQIQLQIFLIDLYIPIYKSDAI